MSKEKPEDNNIIAFPGDGKEQPESPIQELGRVGEFFSKLKPHNETNLMVDPDKQEIDPTRAEAMIKMKDRIKELISTGTQKQKDIMAALRAENKGKPKNEKYNIKIFDEIFTLAQEEIREEYKAKVLKKFEEFAQYSDELPEGKREKDDPNYHKYKCRNNLWGAISSTIQELLKQNIITGDVATECQNFIERADEKIDLKKEKNEPAEDTTPEQIADINNIIELVIRELKKAENKTKQE